MGSGLWWATVLAVVLTGCGSDEGCITVDVHNRIEVELRGFRNASQVCIADSCSSVDDGRARFGDADDAGRDPTTGVVTKLPKADLRVLGHDGVEIESFVDVEVPQHYADGRGCGTYAAVGTVVLHSDGRVETSDDVVE